MGRRRKRRTPLPREEVTKENDGTMNFHFTEH